MRYMGGKSKIACPIAEIITRNSAASTCFVSLFCPALWALVAALAGYGLIAMPTALKGETTARKASVLCSKTLHGSLMQSLSVVTTAMYVYLPTPRFTQTHPIKAPKATTVSCSTQILSGRPCGCLLKPATPCLSVSSKPRQIFSASGSNPLPAP